MKQSHQAVTEKSVMRLPYDLRRRIVQIAIRNRARELWARFRRVFRRVSILRWWTDELETVTFDEPNGEGLRFTGLDGRWYMFASNFQAMLRPMVPVSVITHGRRLNNAYNIRPRRGYLSALLN